MVSIFRRFSTAVHIVALVLVAACSGQRLKADSSAAATRTTLRVALLTPGSISDQSWNGGAYNGLLRIRDSLGASVSHIQTKTPAEFEENFRQYGAQRYDLVFGHGFEFQDAALTVAPAYPGTIFVVTSGNSTAANVAGMVFGFAEPSYLAGLIAGAITKTNRIGVIGGTELPPVRESFLAFAAGARASNPRVQVITSYIGNWDDVGAGKEQALAQLGRGVDVIFQNADAAGRGVIQAVREAPNAYVIGSNGNQNDIAPEVTLGSVVIDLPHAFLTVARQVQDHRFKPGVITLGMREEVVEFVVNPALQSRIPASIRTTVDSVRTLMLARRFEVPLDRTPAH